MCRVLFSLYIKIITIHSLQILRIYVIQTNGFYNRLIYFLKRSNLTYLPKERKKLLLLKSINLIERESIDWRIKKNRSTIYLLLQKNISWSRKEQPKTTHLATKALTNTCWLLFAKYIVKSSKINFFCVCKEEVHMEINHNNQLKDNQYVF